LPFNATDPRPLRSSKPLPFEVQKQEVERSLHHHADVAARIRVTHEIAAALELFAKLCARREFDPEPRLRKLLDASHRSNFGRHIGPRKASGKQRLDLALALVGSSPEKLRVVFLGQPLPQELQRRQVHRPRREQRVDDRKPPPEPRREDAAKRFALAEPELPNAKVEHRRKARPKVQAAFFDFGKAFDELRRKLAMRADELRDVREQFVIGALREVHAFSHTTLIFSLVYPTETADRNACAGASRRKREDALARKR
jgi:hypothetical protein